MARLRFALGIIISAVFLWLALKDQDLANVWDTLTHANYVWIIPGIVTYFFAVVARTWRWHYMLRSIKPVSLRTLFPIVAIGYMGNNIYPARAGEVLRSYVLKKRAGVPMSASLATVVIERLFDGVVMLLFVFVSLPRLETLPDWLRQVVVLGSIVFFSALIVFFVVAARPDHARGMYRWLIARVIPFEFQGRVHGLADRFMEGLASLRRERDVLMIFVTSLVIWLLETVKYWFVMHAFPFEVSFYALMLMNGVVNLATTIPSSPGYVGTFDAPGIAILEAFGVNRAIATGYTLVLHAALWFPITALGLFFMARESLTLAKVHADIAEQAAQPTQRGELLEVEI